MKRSVYAAMLLLAAAVSVQAAPDAGECLYVERPAPASAPVKETTVKVLASSPVDGGDVHKDTVVGVDVEYHVAKFVPDRLYLIALFPTDDGGSTGPGDPTNTPALTSADGIAHLCVPLESIYSNEHMRWPLRMYVLLLEMQGLGGQGTATSHTLKFNAVDPPPGALEPKLDGPAEKFADSVKGSWEYFSNRTVRYKACIARFPDMQPALTRAYRGWESRHRADIDLIAEAKFEMDKARYKGRPDLAAQISDAFVDGHISALQQLPVEQVRPQCQSTFEELADPDDQTNGAIGDYIDYVKKYRADHPPGEAR